MENTPPEAISRAEGCKLPKGVYFPIHPDSRQRIAIFIPERECIGNYPSNSRGLLTVYESIATVGEIRVYWRADFQSGSRVLKKVF